MHALLERGDEADAVALVRAGRLPSPLRRFRIYRNNVFQTAIAALGAVFPVVERLVGADSFRTAANAYTGAGSVWNDKDRENGMFAQVNKFRSTVQRRPVSLQVTESSETHGTQGLVRVRSAYPIEETIERLKKAIAAKRIPFFGSIDQARLAADAGVRVRPSTLLVFGNPALGAALLSSNPYSGLDWPVRLLVHQDSVGNVWVAYTDFTWIARRRRITDCREQFTLASAVVDSITSTVRASSWQS
jgi:uncharacterized protein (DUF302 family)